MKVKGSVALVTGANGGIGQAFVQELLQRGAAKIYLAARDPASLRGLVAKSSKLVPIALDLTNPQQIEAAANTASDVTLLINNAGAVAFSGADTQGSCGRSQFGGFPPYAALEQPFFSPDRFR
jgi:NAD(P)-dependent dehydrogenase (short-subunit alcohol dehydrogenase family)